MLAIAASLLPAASPRSRGICGKGVAVMVSGQVTRYLYRSTFARVPGGARALFAVPDKGCGPKFLDLFAVLDAKGRTEFHLDARYNVQADARAVLVHAGDAEALRRHAVPAIAAHMRQAHGFSRVDVRLLAAADLQDLTARLDEDTVAALADLYSTSKRRWRMFFFQPGARHLVWDRWRRNGQMLLLRHLVFKLALDSGRDHAWYLYLREDTCFLAPPAQLGAAAERARADFATEEGETSVAFFDNRCGFHQAADKTFLANRGGALELFGGNWSAHVHAMVRWAIFGLTDDLPFRVTRMRPHQKVNPDPLMTEAFYLAILVGTRRVKGIVMPFNRLDVRPVAVVGEAAANDAGALARMSPREIAAVTCVCVSHKYWKLCVTEAALNLQSSHVVDCMALPPDCTTQLTQEEAGMDRTYLPAIRVSNYSAPAARSGGASLGRRVR